MLLRRGGRRIVVYIYIDIGIDIDVGVDSCNKGMLYEFIMLRVDGVEA